MSWDLLVYLVAFILQAVLLGITMYQLIVLSDLENDFVNPHDAAHNINGLVVPEYGIQAALVLAMLLSRKWVVLCIELPVLAYHVRTFALNDYKTDVTEIFRQLPRERRKRIIKLAIYMGGFVFIVYKLVETAVHSLMTEEGRAHAAKILREATADM